MRIVLALDGSAASVVARDLVAGLPWPTGSTIAVVGAYQTPIAWMTGQTAAGTWLPQAEDGLRARLREHLAELASPLTDRGLAVEVRVTDGRAADVILVSADELDADLVVLGSRGHGAIGSMLLGSVSAEVADRSERSVLVARHPGVSRVLVATDGSECASVIPEALREWGILRDLPTTALSVAPVDSPAYSWLVGLYTLAQEPLAEQRERLLALHREHAYRMAAQLTEGGQRATPAVRQGDAAQELVGAATDDGADLVVTGSRCLHGVERWLLGSVARNVLVHTHASVLIVRRVGQAGG